MTTVRLLYDLQELDLEINQVRNSVVSIESEVGDRSGLEALKAEVEHQSTLLSDLSRHRKAHDLEASVFREKVQDLEGKLYGGAVKSVRELESGQKEVLFLKEQLQQLDDQVLETMVALDEAQGKISSLEGATTQAEKDWKSRQSELGKERKNLDKTLESLLATRQESASLVGQVELSLYERLRTSKAGQAIARVERGLCRGCRMALPTHQLQRARQGREPVLCNSCGRILFVS